VETNIHDLSHLFRQLGLPDNAHDIDHFIATHRLEKGTRLTVAPFWTPTQAKFLVQAFLEDSDWAEAADELAVRLS
jgi:hypothetical protein